MNCCFPDYSYPDFHRETPRTAKKPHKCCECGARIFPGDLYHYIVQKYDDYLTTWTQCEKCADLFASLSQVWCCHYEMLLSDYLEFLEESGRMYYDEDRGDYIYQVDNHITARLHLRTWKNPDAVYERG